MKWHIWPKFWQAFVGHNPPFFKIMANKILAEAAWLGGRLLGFPVRSDKHIQQLMRMASDDNLCGTMQTANRQPGCRWIQTLISKSCVKGGGSHDKRMLRMINPRSITGSCVISLQTFLRSQIGSLKPSRGSPEERIGAAAKPSRLGGSKGGAFWEMPRGVEGPLGVPDKRWGIVTTLHIFQTSSLHYSPLHRQPSWQHFTCNFDAPNSATTILIIPAIILIASHPRFKCDSGVEVHLEVFLLVAVTTVTRVAGNHRRLDLRLVKRNATLKGRRNTDSCLDGRLDGGLDGRLDRCPHGRPNNRL